MQGFSNKKKTPAGHAVVAHFRPYPGLSSAVIPVKKPDDTGERQRGDKGPVILLSAHKPFYVLKRRLAQHAVFLNIQIETFYIEMCVVALNVAHPPAIRIQPQRYTNHHV